jgi:serine/threonine protein kinase/Tol biopolymer transport system component
MTGEMLGHYRVVEKIGEGGMGVVYKAVDTRLKRTVAIKVLRPHLARNPDRLARFQREAQVLAALNHANIAAIHGVEEDYDKSFLVLEFVDGDTLGDHIARGPMRTRRVIDIASQIARAIEEAHDKGIVHRDLKPSNVKVRPDGTVKVLDFGLAKALSDERLADEVTATDATKEGAILGTPAYMSPEQARGWPIDRSTDIWAFGCVLFEMVAGVKAFQGATDADVKAAVLTGEPPWASFPADASPSLRTLVRSCLETEPKNRLRHMADARLLLETASAEGGSSITESRRSHRRRRVVASAVALAGLAVLAVAIGYTAARLLTTSEPPSVMHVPMAPPFQLEPSLGLGPSVAVSPDGRTLIYVLATGTTSSLYIKQQDERDARQVAGTFGARSPFFSPGGEWVGFYDEDDRKLKRVSVGGGEPVTIADADFEGGAVWAPDGMILFASGHGLMRVPAGGGAPQAVTKTEVGQQMWPTLLPGGRVALFTNLPARGSFDEADILAMRLPDGSPKVVLKSAYYPHYAPTGHLVFVQGDSILAAPFDAETLEVTGPAVTVLRDAWISSWVGYADFAFSQTGTLVYVSGGPDPTKSTLVTIDRNGVESTITGERRAYRAPRLSPDGRQVAVTLVDEHVDIWTYELAGKKSLNRLTDSPSWDAYPLWQPKTDSIAFSSMRDGVASVYRQHLRDGTVEKLVATEHPTYPSSWSPDGTLLAYSEENPQTGMDIWIYSVVTRKSEVFLRTPYNELHAEFSPDGKYIAYDSGEAGGQTEVYVRPYPAMHPRRKVSTNGGTSPRWGANGDLFYRIRGAVMGTKIEATPDLVVGASRQLLTGPYGGYDVDHDGQTFILVKEMGPDDPPTRINLIVNWFEDLKRLKR